MLIQWEPPDEVATGIRIFRDGAEVAALGPETTSYEDTDLKPNTRYTYKVVVATRAAPDAVTEASAATLAYQPQGADVRNIEWTRLQFYVVDERNPDYTEYHIALRYPGGATAAVSDWGRQQMQVIRCRFSSDEVRILSGGEELGRSGDRPRRQARGRRLAAS